MEADEIIHLDRDTVQMLLDSRRAQRGQGREPSRRHVERIAFPGTTQVWIAEPNGGEKLTIGTCTDVSGAGLGLRLDESLPVGITVSIAIHQPEASYHGKAVVRHCTPRKKSFFVGMQFQFD